MTYIDPLTGNPYRSPFDSDTWKHVRRIKFKGGPLDGTFKEVNIFRLDPSVNVVVTPPLTVTFTDEFDANLRIAYEIHHYRLQYYTTTRFGGRYFVRYVYFDKKTTKEYEVSSTKEDVSCPI